MSRVSLIEQLYAPKKKSALEFNYDALWAPPIRFFLSQQDINELHRIATSLKYNDNIEKKYELIDAVMRPRGFKRGNCGTNRVVYNFLEDTSFCMKIALDRVGINDSPREFKNQEFFKPFCCKIFEVDPTGVIACVERVNPISSLEEFMSISDDVFNMMITKIIGKYVVDDLGTEKYLNYGLRYNSNGIAFGPVILDYPYAYELDGAKLRCGKPIQIGNKEYACGGEIDYDSGLNNLVCCKCGRHYSARELAKDDSNVLKFYSDDSQCTMRARIIRGSDGTIVKDSGRSSKLYMTKEEYEEGTRLFELKDFGPRRVSKTIKNKYTPIKKLREEYYTELQAKAYEEMKKRNAEPFNPVIEPELGPRTAKRARKKETENTVKNSTPVSEVVDYEIPRVRRARRAEDLIDNEESKNKLNDSDSLKEIADHINSNKEELKTEESDIELARKFLESSYEYPNNIELPEFSADAKKSEEADNYNLKSDLTEVIHEIINEDTHYEYPEETGESEAVSGNNIEEMEAAVFPEMVNKEITIGVKLSEETDYSNYEPSEEYNDDNHNEDEEDPYSEYYEVDHKYKRRDKKQQNIKNKKYVADDMSDY